MSAFRRLAARFTRSAENMLELARFGRFTDPYGAPFDVVDEGPHHRLRRYRGRNHARAIDTPILLVPPLMVATEVYDIAEDISAVKALLGEGADVWVCDFGRPEAMEGGLARTLDDHLHAVDACIDYVAKAAGSDVHLAGYSQGGMFCYQAAAYRRSRGLASIITFGSPVDIHRNLPKVADGVAAEIARILQALIARPLEEIEGLPGFLTSTAFKMVSIRKEASQVVEFFSKLHDRQALERREGRRRFLGGDGFVAWPGPALRTFVEEFIVHNRMLSGGFVVDGQTVTLGDITCPVLFFVGTRDEIVRPAAVRAVRHVVRSKEIFEASIPAGHFGLVVGSRALDRSWPLVLDWMRWREGKGTRPRVLREEDPPVEIEDAAFAEDDFDVRLFVDAAKDVAGSAWRAVGELIEDAGQYGQNLRYQLPRLAELEALTDTTRVSLSRTLAQRAVESPDRTFFLWRGRAFTYEDSNRRVDAVVRGLWHVGVRPGSRVAVVMGPRPSLLTAVAALSRIGAVSVLIREAADLSEVQRSMDLAGADLAIVDPERAERLLSVCMGGVYVLGGGQDRRVAEGAFDLEALDVEGIELPAEFVADPLCGGDLSNVFFSPARTGDGLRLARITARRWAASAIGAAAACTLSPDDTVYSALPLHHIGGLLVSVGGAMVGGARLALADSESSGFPPVLGKPTAFWDEVRRYGATVVFYAGDAARSLVDAPRASRDRSSPVRLFAGSGMRAGVWRQLQDRFGASVVEFYASSEVPAILANMTGLKVGSVGVPLPGSSEVALARFDARGIERERGRAQRTADGEWGMLLVRLEPSDECDEGRLEVDVFEHEDRWLRTGDVLLRDVDGDYHFMGRERDVLQAGGRWASLREVEDALDAVDGVRIAVADMSTGVPRVRIVLREDAPTMSALRKALAHLPAPLDGAALEIVQPEAIRFTAGYRPLR